MNTTVSRIDHDCDGEPHAAGDRAHQAAVPVEPVAGFGNRELMLGGAATVASQGISSATTFLRMVLLGRVCGEAEVGVYAMTFTAVMLLFVVHERLIESGYLACLHRREAPGQRSLLGNTILLSTVFALVGGVIIGLVGLGSAAVAWLGWSETSSAMSAAFLATAIATPPIVLRELARSASYAHFKVVDATIIDVITLIVQVALLAAFWQAGVLSVTTTYIAIGASSLAGCAWWLSQWRERWQIEPRELRADWSEMWWFSRWLLAARVLGQGSRFIMPWIVAAYLGFDRAGVLAMCLTLVGLSWIFVRGINNYFRPMAVYAFHHGGVAAVRRAVWRTSCIFGVLLLGLCGVYAAVGAPLFELTFNSDPEGVWLVLLLQGFNTLAASLAIAPTNGLAAIDRPQANLWVEGLTFLVTAALAPWLTASHGLAGASVAMLAGNIVGAITAFFLLERSLVQAQRGSAPHGFAPRGGVARSLGPGPLTANCRPGGFE